MKRRDVICLICACCSVLAHQTAQAEPPFWGTIFVDPNIITPADPTTFQSLSYSGRASRPMFDRRISGWSDIDAYLFDATFDDGLTCEIQVNPEFGNADAALEEAQKYGWSIGQLPTALRTDVQTVWIHKGINPFGGGNNNLLIHTGQGELYIAEGILEETLVHEAAHTSLDATHAAAAGWRAAQTADGEFISAYARDFPAREDIAETFLLFLALRYRLERISAALENTILQTIPNRLAYLDSQLFDMYPIVLDETRLAERLTDTLPPNWKLRQNYPNPFNADTIIEYQIAAKTRVALTIMNLLGQKVRTLVDGEQTAGIYRKEWNGRDYSGRRLASGVYLYRLEVQEFTLERKMILLQ